MYFCYQPSHIVPQEGSFCLVLFELREWDWVWFRNKIMFHSLIRGWRDASSSLVQALSHGLWAELLIRLSLVGSGCFGQGQLCLLSSDPSARYRVLSHCLLTSFWVCVSSALLLHKPVHLGIGHNHFVAGTLVWSKGFEAPVLSTLWTQRKRKKKLRLSYYPDCFYFLRILNGFCHWHFLKRGMPYLHRNLYADAHMCVFYNW